MREVLEKYEQTADEILNLLREERSRLRRDPSFDLAQTAPRKKDLIAGLSAAVTSLRRESGNLVGQFTLPKDRIDLLQQKLLNILQIDREVERQFLSRNTQTRRDSPASSMPAAARSYARFATTARPSVKGPEQTEARQGGNAELLSDEDFEFLRSTVFSLSRISLGAQKKTMVSSRLIKRMRALGLPDAKAYCQYLRKAEGKSELSCLIDAVSTNHTYFFREADHFDFLTREILKNWRGSPSRPFACWSAACSSGEEPYSVAMILEEQRRVVPAFKWTMVATDISTTALAKAQEGNYPKAAIERVPEVLLKKYFTPEGEGIRIQSNLKELIRFTQLNLFSIPQGFPGPFDLILCRNVMIYFDRATREELVASLTDRLVPGGILFVGHSESLSGMKHSLNMLRPAIYQKP